MALRVYTLVTVLVDGATPHREPGVRRSRLARKRSPRPPRASLGSRPARPSASRSTTRSRARTSNSTPASSSPAGRPHPVRITLFAASLHSRRRGSSSGHAPARRERGGSHRFSFVGEPADWQWRRSLGEITRATAPAPHRRLPRKTEDGGRSARSRSGSSAKRSRWRQRARRGPHQLLGKDVPRHEDAREATTTSTRTRPPSRCSSGRAGTPKTSSDRSSRRPSQMRRAQHRRVGVLMNHYFSVQAEVGPIISGMTPEVDAFVDAFSSVVVTGSR